MGNEHDTCCPKKTNPPKPKSIPEKDKSELNKLLNEQCIELKEIEEIVAYAKERDARNPLVVCISTKTDAGTVLKEQKTEPDYLRIVNGSTHREIKSAITDIVKDLDCDNPKYDALIILLLTICFVSSDPESKDKHTSLNFYYDKAEVPRHAEKLKKDVIYRLGIPVVLNYSKSIQFSSGLSSNSESNKPRISSQMDESNPNGQIEAWIPFKKNVRHVQKDAIKPQADTDDGKQEVQQDIDDLKEEEQKDDE